MFARDDDTGYLPKRIGCYAVEILMVRPEGLVLNF
jgi:hypothetical protein